jgi:phospholipid/cholesterol/gamma-HCH transport system substrate-binding protein
MGMAMRHHKLNYVIVGFFVIAMIGVAFGSFILLTGQARETDQYYIVMDNVADVKFGTQVRYEGYPIGQVDGISPFAESGRMRFRLDVSVLAGWRVPDNSIARIGSTSFLAAKTVDIAAGDSTTALQPETMIGSATTRDMFVMMANMADEFGQLGRGSLRPLIDNISTLALRAGGALETDLGKLTASLNAIVSLVEGRAGPILNRVESAARRLDDSSAGLRKILSDENIAVIDGAVVNVGDMVRNFNTISQELKTAEKQLEKTLSQVNGLVAGNRANVDKVLTNARYTLQSVSRNIDSIMQNVDVTSRNMSEFSRQIRQNPSMLLGGPAPREISPASSRFGGINQ